MTLYAVMRYGIYQQGCCGIFDTQEAAESCARDYAHAGDGYHEFKVEPYTLNAVVPKTLLYSEWRPLHYGDMPLPPEPVFTIRAERKR